ncbi:sensor histidine kinase [Sphaerisporangium aureirubrum]|uniref:histidine kinase n=1 Tax=Sphaerisporangium aureirubrum TaxID=1544736 RepID=A0ABW1NQJ2_9ACTN
MVDVPSEWPVLLLWPLFTLLTWMIVAKGLTLLLARGKRCAPYSVQGQITLLAAAVIALTFLTRGAGIYLLARSGTIPHALPHAVTLAAGSRVAAGSRQPLPVLAWPGSLRLIVAIETAELVALSAWVTWTLTGRVLRPVDAVRAELSRIDFGDPAARVSEPGKAREITRLCRTINTVLGRLHKAQEERAEIAHRQWQFASDVSHELRTPITGLRVQLEVAQQDPRRARLSELLGTTLNQVERLEMITEDILSLARVRARPPVEPRRLDLAALVEVEVAQRTDRLPVRLHLTPGTTVTAVPSQIGRVLANLLDNAQRHATRLVSVEVRATRAAVELAVSDDGKGIAEADRERVFQRLIRLDDARRLDRNGTGLGLAIARDIAHAHHGTLSVEESATGGARFVLRLPRVLPHGEGRHEA